jgi:uncharacterized protein
VTHRRFTELPALTLALAAAAVWAASASTQISASGIVETGRFVWRDVLTTDVAGARRFYGDLFGWQFDDTQRGGQPYVIARLGHVPVAGIVDVSALAGGAGNWLSYMAVDDVNAAVARVRAAGGKVLVEPRDRPVARVAVVTDPQNALLGLAQLNRSIPGPAQATAYHFFWQEYLARDAKEALEFYRALAGYTSTIGESNLGVDYYVLRRSQGIAGLFQLPATNTDVQPNWLPYVLVDDPASLAGRVPGLGGRILVPSAPERRNGSLVVIADPGGAAIALQKYPF